MLPWICRWQSTQPLRFEADVRRQHAGQRPAAVVDAVRMAVGVAVGAQRRRLLREQALVRRAVRRVADGAVLFDRRVLVNPRAALVGVAGRAQVDDRVAAQTRLDERAVRVVAVLAAHLAFDDRVVRGLEDLGAHVAVALDAALVDELAGGRRVRRGRELRSLDLLVVARRLGAVHRVAVDARHVDLAVLRDRPVLEVARRRMAGEAHRRFRGRRRDLGAEHVFGLVTRVLQVRRCVAVARLARASVRIVLCPVRRQQDRAVLRLVALDAHRHVAGSVCVCADAGNAVNTARAVSTAAAALKDLIRM